jgi:drug/metabolite transporter (DMT)-like permease
VRIYVWSMALAITGQVAYHLAQKAIPRSAQPFFVLAIAYALASLVSLAIILLAGKPPRVADFGQLLCWPVVLLALSVVAIEVGYLLAYRSGWTLGIAFAFSSTSTVVLLGITAVLWFGDSLTFGRAMGLLLALAGTWLLLSPT